MNIEAYNLDSLRRLVRDLQTENRSLKSLLKKADIPYAQGEAFLDTPTISEEYDPDQGARINRQYIDKNMATKFFAMFWGREDIFAKRAKNGNYYSQCDNRWNNVLCPKQKGQKMYCEDCEHTLFLISIIMRREQKRRILQIRMTPGTMRWTHFV